MNPTRRPAVLNRAIFTNRSFDSRALSVLTTLVHRLSRPGTMRSSSDVTAGWSIAPMFTSRRTTLARR
jgi:hypothetical protein